MIIDHHNWNAHDIMKSGSVKRYLEHMKKQCWLPVVAKHLSVLTLFSHILIGFSPISTAIYHGRFEKRKWIFGVHTEKNISTIEIKLNLFKSQKLSIKYLFRLLQLSKRQQEMAIDEDVESSQACPSMSYLFPGNTNYAKDIRSPLANFVPTRTKTSNLVRKLHASDFQSNNDDHLNLVKNMGINIISLPDDRVQLLHTLSNVNSLNTYFQKLLPDGFPFESFEIL